MSKLVRILRSPSIAVPLYLVALFASSAHQALGQDLPSQIIVFGDSLSDPGNGFSFVKENATPPDYGMNALLVPSAPYARGGHHLSNGPTWIELLARSLGAPRSALGAFQSANPHAMNFAIGTARARVDGSNPSLALEVAAFLQKTGGVAPSDALYVIQIGSNDVRDALAVASLGGDPLPILQAAAAAIAEAVNTLYLAGARNFLVWNVPDAGLTPAVLMLDAINPGTAFAATLATQTFNALLQVALAPLSGLPGITLVPFDAFALLNAIVSAPAAYGLTNVTTACVTPNDPPFACTNPDQYLFWDGIHPTAATHAIIASAVALLLG